MERKEYKEYGLKDRAAQRKRKIEVNQLLLENKLVPPEKLVPIVDREKAYLRYQKEITEQVRLRKEEGEGSSDDESIVFVLDKEGDISIKLQLDFVAFQEEEERQERLDNREESSDSEDSVDEYAWYNKFS